MGNLIPKGGHIVLEAGELVAYRFDMTECGRIYVGNNGLVVEGELTIWQDEDPPKLRLASSYDSWRGSLGLVSFNMVRPDGSQDEVAWMRGSVAEDALPGDVAGQFDLYIRRKGDAEPSHALIASDAYSERSGERRTRVLMSNPVNGLAEFA
jgi:hypothetical protein